MDDELRKKLEDVAGKHMEEALAPVVADALMNGSSASVTIEEGAKHYSGQNIWLIRYQGMCKAFGWEPEEELIALFSNPQTILWVAEKKINDLTLKRMKDLGMVTDIHHELHNRNTRMEGLSIGYVDHRGQRHTTKPLKPFLLREDAPHLTDTQRKLINNSLSGAPTPRSGHSSMTADCRVLPRDYQGPFIDSISPIPPGSDAVLQNKHRTYGSRKIKNASLSGTQLPRIFDVPESKLFTGDALVNSLYKLNGGLSPGQLSTLTPPGSEGLFPKTNFTHYLWQQYLKKTGQLPKIGYTAYEELGPMVTEFAHPEPAYQIVQPRQTGKTGIQAAMFEAVTDGWYFAGTWIKPLVHAMGLKPPRIQ